MSLVEYSGRLHGLVIYLSQLVSPFWQSKVTKQRSGALLSLNTSLISVVFPARKVGFHWAPTRIFLWERESTFTLCVSSAIVTHSFFKHHPENIVVLVT